MSGDRPRVSGPVPRRKLTEPEVGFEPTLESVSRQVGTLSQQMSAVLSAVSANAQQTGYLAQRVEGVSNRVERSLDDFGSRLTVFHKELLLQRQTQVEDHAPRLREVEQEQKAAPRSIAPAAKAVGRYSLPALGSWTIFEIIAALQQHAGPIGQLLKSWGILK